MPEYKLRIRFTRKITRKIKRFTSTKSNDSSGTKKERLDDRVFRKFNRHLKQSLHKLATTGVLSLGSGWFWGRFQLGDGLKTPDTDEERNFAFERRAES